MNTRLQRLIACPVVLFCLGFTASAQETRPDRPPGHGETPMPASETEATPDEPVAVPPVDPAWLDRLPRVDRLLLDELLGYAPPDFTGDLQWFGSDALTWEELRGKVVVLQSWTTRKSGVVNRLESVLDPFAPEDVQVLLLHTPEHADRAGRYLERRPMAHPVILDTLGAFSDALGVYKSPTNVVVDRQGVVRYVGLNWDGLEQAVTRLVAESFDPAKKPPSREEAASSDGFPEFKTDVGSASDLRGRRAPDLFVTQWVTPRPKAAGKVVVVDFWSTEQPRYYRHLTHLNDLADAFGREVVIVGIAPESSGKLRSFLRGAPVRYTIASDQSMSPDREEEEEGDDWSDTATTRMKEAVGSEDWPYTLVMSADWVVRWQGRPGDLTRETLRSIVEGNVQLREEARTPSRNRWTSGE